MLTNNWWKMIRGSLQGKFFLLVSGLTESLWFRNFKTRGLDYFNIWLLTAMKNCPIAQKLPLELYFKDSHWWNTKPFVNKSLASLYYVPCGPVQTTLWICCAGQLRCQKCEFSNFCTTAFSQQLATGLNGPLQRSLIYFVMGKYHRMTSFTCLDSAALIMLN